MESRLAVALGGRLAEEVVYGEDGVTTGASNDIQQVADAASRMVKEFGMSRKIGNIALGAPQGRQPSQWGDEINATVEQEVERLVNNSYLIAKKILQDNVELFEELTEALMERDTVTAEEFQMLLVKHNAQTIKYQVIGEIRNRELLPFQSLPDSV